MRNLKPQVWTCICISTAAIGALVSGLVVAHIHTGINIPDFTDETKTDVETWRTDNKLDESRVVYVYQYSLKEDKDVVLEQSLPENDKLNENENLYIILSNGADPYEEFTLPDFTDKTIDEIKTYFTENKFPDVTYTEVESDVEDNKFVDMTPGVNSKVMRRDHIEVKYSKPAKEVTVPDLMTYSLDNLNAWAEENGININLVKESSDTVAEGSLISVSTEAGKTIHEGDTIGVKVSTGQNTPEQEEQKEAEEKNNSSSSNNTNSSSSNNSAGNSGGTTSGNSNSGNSGTNNNTSQANVPEVYDNPLSGMSTDDFDGWSADQIRSFINNRFTGKKVSIVYNTVNGENPGVSSMTQTPTVTEGGTVYVTIITN